MPGLWAGTDPPPPTPRGLQERYSESTAMGVSRRPPEPEKVPAAAPARPSALELKVEELEEKGLIRILRGPGDAVSIEILPVTVATPSGSDAPTLGVPTGSPSPGEQQRPAGWGRVGELGPGEGAQGHHLQEDLGKIGLGCGRCSGRCGWAGNRTAAHACGGEEETRPPKARS